MGTPVRVGVCAVDPKVIPLGSIVEIKGIGRFRAEDTGSKVKGRVIDIYMPNCVEAKKFGVQWRKFEIERR
jgi:3D (Asp-Asp-Asp) domain-containing protein